TGQWQPLGSIAGRTYLFLGLSGLATGASWLCYFRALQLGDAALVAPIDKLSVVLVALFGVTILGERLSGLNWLGIALIAGGAILAAHRGGAGQSAASVSGPAAETAPQLDQPVERRERALVSHGGQAHHDRLQADERDAVQGRLFRV